MSIVAPILSSVAGFDPLRDMEGFRYDEALADRAADFFPQVLRHVQNSYAVRANTPFHLEPWQETIVRALFGIVHDGGPQDGLRRFRQAYIEIPRKNGKTTFAAGLCLYGLFCDGEAAAQIFCAASSQDQATLAYDIAAGMVLKSEILKTECKVRKSTKRILFRDSYFRSVAADPDRLHGAHTHIVLADEIHAWKGGGQETWGVLETGCAARPQPIMIGITTAGHDRESKCYELHEYAKGGRDGKINDPSFLPIVFGIEPDDDWTSEEVWFRANPNLEISLPIAYIRQQCEKAKQFRSFQNTFRRLHLNQWTSQETRWLDMAEWHACMGA